MNDDLKFKKLVFSPRSLPYVRGHSLWGHCIIEGGGNGICMPFADSASLQEVFAREDGYISLFRE
jgi:hypothetical protein